MKPDALLPFAEALRLPVRALFPQGPRPQAEGGYSWWGRRSIAAGESHIKDLAHYRPTGRTEARELLASFLSEARAAAPDQPLVLAGFSQGGMLACDFVLHDDLSRVDALVLLSASRIAFDDWQPRLSRIRGMPVLVAHGVDDHELSFEAGESLYRCLADAGAQVQWMPFDGGHEIPLGVWRRLRRFVIQAVARPRSTAA